MHVLTFRFGSLLHQENTAVKHKACTRESILAGLAPNSREKYPRKTWKTKAISQNRRKKIEPFIEIDKKETKAGKRKTQDFLNRKLIEVRVSCYLAFCFELCQKSFTLVNNVTNWLVRLFVTFVRQLVLTAWKHATQWLQNFHMR